MPQKRLIAELVKVNPDTLIRRYLKIGIVSMVAILSFTSYGIYRAYLSRIVANAESSAVSLASALMDVERKHLVTRAANGTDELQVTDSTIPRLNRDLGLFFRHFNILKIKIYDRKARIIYSTDPTNIGKSDSGNPRLANALAGANDSKVVKKEKVLDFDGQEKFAVDVVEAYIPVHDATGRVIGSFELYLDVTRYRNEILRFVILSGGMLFLILLWVFVISFMLLRKEAVQLKAAQKALESQAATDFLTGTCNRRQLLVHCEEVMSDLVEAGAGDMAGARVGFIMLDIDHFKRINDTFGHAAGDEIIRELALRLRNSVRQPDIVGRYGGEEFLVVLPNATEEQLGVIADRLWSSVRSTPFRFGGESIPVTVSLGVAVSSGTEESHEEIIRRADGALYRSKNEGRDTIRYAYPSEGEAVYG